MALARIGIELEFMVPVLDGGKQTKTDNHKDDRWPDSPANHDNIDNPIFGNNSCRKAVCHALAGCGLPVARLVDPNPLKEDPDASEDTHHLGIDLSPTSRLLVWNPAKGGTDGKKVRFNYWFVDYEASVTRTIEDNGIKAPAGYRWYAVEINSQILSDQAELNEKLPTLRRALASVQDSIKVWLNAECGFHIHVSPLSGELGIVVARRITALVVLVEQALLLNLCHPCRRKSLYVRPISTDSMIATSVSVSQEPPALPGPEVDLIRKHREKANSRSSDEPRIFRMLCAIFAETDCESLAKGLRLPKTTASRCGLAISEFGTVEFRYPEATFDVEFLSLWVDLARQLFSLAAAPDEQYGSKLCELYKMATANMQLGWIHWLNAVGLSERAGFCKRQVSRYSRDLKDLNKVRILPKVGLAK